MVPKGSSTMPAGSARPGAADAARLSAFASTAGYRPPGRGAQLRALSGSSAAGGRSRGRWLRRARRPRWPRWPRRSGGAEASSGQHRAGQVGDAEARSAEARSAGEAGRSVGVSMITSSSLLTSRA
eukprot:4246255-Heterocapsa_arctica.AAC.1